VTVSDDITLTPDLLLRAYAYGVFPMGEDRDDPKVFWVDPPQRGIFPLDSFHVPRRLARLVASDRFSVSHDTGFRDVMRACAEPAPGRTRTWINDTIIDVYCELFARGFAHSIECRLGGELVGGLYGVSIGAAFFGESMFSRTTDASKVALVHLVARLRTGRFLLLDTQFVTEHLARFGAVEMSRMRYRRLLRAAIGEQADFDSLPAYLPGATILQSITQTS
jgi:leucyl/phenylalanyl-tRNA--protein transferase